MALNVPATATSYSGFWGQNQYQLAYSRNNTIRQIAMTLGKPSNNTTRKIMRALNGVAPGGAVADTRVRIASFTGGPGAVGGGLRTVETVTGPDNGVTTTAQRDYLNTNVYDAVVTTAQPYPVDLSGNGGGGKVQR